MVMDGGDSKIRRLQYREIMRCTAFRMRWRRFTCMHGEPTSNQIVRFCPVIPLGNMVSAAPD